MTQPTARFSGLSLLPGRTDKFTAEQESEADGVSSCLKINLQNEGTLYRSLYLIAHDFIRNLKFLDCEMFIVLRVTNPTRRLPRLARGFFVQPWSGKEIHPISIALLNRRLA
jgi:hypothetical protein